MELESHIINETPVVEIRLQEDQRVSRVSDPTLRYMYRYGLALEARLGWHEANLVFRAEEECDLFEAMRLSARLKRVDRNIRRVARRNARMRDEFLRRALQTTS